MEIYAIFNDLFFIKKPWWMPEKLYDVVCQRANPRAKEYMINVLCEKFPQAKLVDREMIPQSTKNVILLYPDSIGLGYGALEKKILGTFEVVTVLNGRKRLFLLTSGIRRMLFLKRFLELTFFPEIIFAPFLLVMGASLAVKDKLMARLS